MWDDFSHVSKLTSHLAHFVDSLQRRDCTRGAALEKYIHVRKHIVDHASNLPSAARGVIVKQLEVRDAQFYSRWSCTSNIMDVRYRGLLLPSTHLRETLSWILLDGWKIMDRSPMARILCRNFDFHPNNTA